MEKKTHKKNIEALKARWRNEYKDDNEYFQETIEALEKKNEELEDKMSKIEYGTMKNQIILRILMMICIVAFTIFANLNIIPR